MKSDVNPNIILIAIAKRCGWYDIQANLSESKSGYIGTHALIPSYAHSIHYQGYAKDGSARCDYGAPVPNYLESLDAMHRAESCLEEDEWLKYTDILYANCNDRKRGDIHASATVKARAYYTVISK